MPSRRRPLRLKLFGVVALPLVTTVLATGLSWSSYQALQTQYERALGWQNHAMLASQQARLAAQYTHRVEEVLAAPRAEGRDQAEALAQRLLETSTQSVRLAVGFAADEIDEENELHEALTALTTAGSTLMAVAEADGRRLPLEQELGRVHAFSAVADRLLETRMREEAEGSQTWQGIAQKTAESRSTLGVLICCCALAMLVPGFMLARELRQSVRALHEGALRAGQGDFSEPVEVRANDELGDLARLFNDMSRAISTQHATLRRANEELRSTLVALEKANATKTRFLSTMSHEIRTPLAGVMGTLELLAASPPTSEQVDYANVALRSASALLALLNDILDFSKIEAQGIELSKTTFDFLEAAREVGELFLARARTNGLELHLSGLEGQAFVEGDALRVKQVLSNLLGNAVKFTEVGAVSLTVERQNVGDTTTLRCVVEDTGIGVSPQFEAQLFEPFVQGDDSSRRRFGGSGLGLSICKRLTELMGGSLSFERPAQGGSRFVFALTLPTATALSSPTVAALTVAERRAVAGLRVLAAEDNPVNQLVLKALLARLGCHPTMAEHGARALEALAEAPFDVVLMDMQMPVLDGLQATRTLRSCDADWRSIPVVALTANAFDDDRQACRAAGMDDFLAKPVSEVALVRALLRAAKRTACAA